MLIGVVLTQCILPPAPPATGAAEETVLPIPTAGEAASETEAVINLPPGIPDGAELAHVIRVLDGGTIVVDLHGTEEIVRYILLDPPQQDEFLYNEAAKLNQLILGNRPIYLLRDVSDRDDQGRLLRYVYSEDSVLVNAEIVRQGMAKVVMSSTDTRFQPLMEEAEREAEESGVGLWD